MSQTDSTVEKRGKLRKWVFFFLCFAALLLFCGVPGVILRISRLPPFGDDAIQTRNREDINELSEAIVNFQTKFNVDYIPSRFVLCERSDDYFSDAPEDRAFKSQLHADSYQYLMRLWPRLNWNNINTPTNGKPWNGIDWNGDGHASPEMNLVGVECLVFFLGGMQSTLPGNPQFLGFATDSRNPAAVGGARIGPLFQFQASRLHWLPDGYLVYLDIYGKKPYAFFSSYKTRNGYNRYGDSDCALIPDGPYHDGKGNYYNPDAFQIISAGADGKFGRGGIWTPANAMNIDADGRDDMTNFHPTVLGKPQ
jgi:hypothetical protein